MEDGNGIKKTREHNKAPQHTNHKTEKLTSPMKTGGNFWAQIISPLHDKFIVS